MSAGSTISLSDVNRSVIAKCLTSFRRKNVRIRKKSINVEECSRPWTKVIKTLFPVILHFRVAKLERLLLASLNKLS